MSSDIEENGYLGGDHLKNERSTQTLDTPANEGGSSLSGKVVKHGSNSMRYSKYRTTLAGRIPSFDPDDVFAKQSREKFLGLWSQLGGMSQSKLTEENKQNKNSIISQEKSDVEGSSNSYIQKPDSNRFGNDGSEGPSFSESTDREHIKRRNNDASSTLGEEGFYGQQSLEGDVNESQGFGSFRKESSKNDFGSFRREQPQYNEAENIGLEGSLSTENIVESPMSKESSRSRMNTPNTQGRRKINGRRTFAIVTTFLLAGLAAVLGTTYYRTSKSSASSNNSEVLAQPTKAAPPANTTSFSTNTSTTSPPVSAQIATWLETKVGREARGMIMYAEL